MIKLDITDLYLEITRRCNMACRHCIRGEAQDMDMSVQTLDNLFSRISHVDTLTFTGGEPSLVPHLLEAALAAAKKHKVSVSQVYIVINGKEVTDAFLNIVREWHMYCILSSQITGKHIDPKTASYLIKTQSDNSDCYLGTFVALSMDQFHEPVTWENFLKLSTLPNLVTHKIHTVENTEWIRQEGRALNDFPDGMNPRETYAWEYSNKKELTLEEYEENILNTDNLFIGANGLIAKYCDYSYASLSENSIGIIMTDRYDPDWLDILIEKYDTERN